MDGRLSLTVDVLQRTEAMIRLRTGHSGLYLEPGAEYHVTLEPGEYVIICNLPGHVTNGMVVDLDVTG